MCGIIAYSSRKPIDHIEFNMMRDSLSHRGPDGYGSHFLENDRIALGHRRLSIIDLSANGSQPMTNERGDIWLTYNGEIYNYQSLRDELLKCGHIFISNTDSEILIHGYEEWGTRILNRIQGMFAFALYDVKKSEWFIARDHFGIKPLYYFKDENTFIASSEIRAISAWPMFKKELDWDSIADYLLFRFIPSPKTIWKSVYKLEPGHYLTLCSKTGRIKTHKEYWSAKSFVSGKNKFDDEYFNALLSSSVKDNLVSDVPVGLFLSGGLDSSIVAYYASQHTESIKSFTLGFEGWEQSEHRDAEHVAKKLGIDHRSKVVGAEIIQDLKRVSGVFDEPLADSSCVPTFELSKYASKDLKVVLAGDGGDELLGGYVWDKIIYEKYRTGLSWLKIRKNRYHYVPTYQSNLIENTFDYTFVSNLMNGRKLSSGNIYERFIQKAPSVPFSIKSSQLLNINTFMTDDFLVKVDRASMSNSLEVRVPLLNHKLFEYVLSCDYRGYFDSFDQKKPFKKILGKIFDEKIIKKRKQGFRSPIKSSNNLEMYYRVLAKSDFIKDNFNLSLIDKLKENGQFPLLYRLYVLELWRKEWYK